jgi:hypothetical protein
LVEDASEISADHEAGAMGIDSMDLNGDGLPDYCITEWGLLCIKSDPSGQYVQWLLEQTTVQEYNDPEGLVLPLAGIWSGYSLEFADLENDSAPDIVAAAGVPRPNWSEDDQHLDLIFDGQPDGSFVDRSVDLGFDDPSYHMGGAAADFDGDGYLDLVMASANNGPVLWMNQCGENAWVDIVLEGQAGNSLAFGAEVSVKVGDRLQVRELHGLRAFGQGPAQLHFGLGNAERIERLEVRWPNGGRSEYTNIPTRRVLTISHPDA